MADKHSERVPPDEDPPAETPVFLFMGYGSEYSLHDLYAYMTAAGDRCVEIDMLSNPDAVGLLRALEGRRKLIFLTSAHLLYDDRNFYYYKTHRRVISALHVISTLQPLASVYYPHDLNDPIQDEEIPYLALFDLFLSPLPGLRALERYLPVRYVGWIKCTPKVRRVMPEDFNPGGLVFLPGAYEYNLKRGFDRFYESYKPLFDAGAAVKLPRWHQNEPFEEFLRERGVRVYPSGANSMHVMEENEVVFTEALSSVGREACGLGKKVCYIRNAVYDYKDPERDLTGAGQITFVNSPAEAAALHISELRANSRTLAYFDFARARGAILEAAAPGSKG